MLSKIVMISHVGSAEMARHENMMLECVSTHKLHVAVGGKNCCNSYQLDAKDSAIVPAQITSHKTRP